MAPRGRMPINIDCAANLSIVIPYSSLILAIGIEVIYLRLYPKFNALSEMISPIIIYLVVLFNLSSFLLGSDDEALVY
jgi:hypothetical protein